MKNLRHLIAVCSLLTLTSAMQAQQSGALTITKPKLRQELLKRVAEDQAIRNELIKGAIDHPDPKLLKRMKKIDAANTARVKTLIKQYGWPGPELV